jgi:hypothetical protein
MRIVLRDQGLVLLQTLELGSTRRCWDRSLPDGLLKAELWCLMYEPMFKIWWEGMIIYWCIHLQPRDWWMCLIVKEDWFQSEISKLWPNASLRDASTTYDLCARWNQVQAKQHTQSQSQFRMMHYHALPILSRVSFRGLKNVDFDKFEHCFTPIAQATRPDVYG